MTPQWSPKYELRTVIAIEDGAMVGRHVLVRLEDGFATVVHMEFHDPLSEPDRLISETITPFHELGLTSRDEENWQFYSTIQEAIAESRQVMGGFADWMKNARNY